MSMSKAEHNLAARKATYYKLVLDEKHCPIEGHFGQHDAEGAIEPHRVRDLFRVMMFLVYGQSLDQANLSNETEHAYMEHIGEREFLNLHIEDGKAKLISRRDGKTYILNVECDGETPTELHDGDPQHPSIAALAGVVAHTTEALAKQRSA